MKTHWAAVTLLFLVAAAWGATFTVIKDLLASIAPEPFIFLRFMLAGIVLALIAITRDRLKPVPQGAPGNGPLWGQASACPRSTALAFVALMWGQARVTATEAAVMLAFEPVSASFTSILLGREALTLTFAAGAALILAAMIFSQLPVSPKRDPIAP